MECICACLWLGHSRSVQDWWVSKMIKKHKSTVLSVAWHPNSQLLATGACDFKCRVFSAYVDADGVDKATGPQGGPFANVMYQSRAWLSVCLCREPQ